MRIRSYVALGFACAIVMNSPQTDAACVAEASPSGTDAGLVIHLPPSCTLAERETHAVRAETIMAAIADGRPVDLLGVIVRGDLLLDRLAVHTAPRSSVPTPETSGQADRGDDKGQRRVREALSLRESVVLGAVRHRSVDSTIRFEGPVDFVRSHFKQGVDLSRSVFDEPLDLSGATFDKEAYFVQGEFTKQLDCRDAKFGPSTRLHRSVFHGPVNCTGALFDGMAEFLEVTFERPAAFERSRFGMGAGFSGSRFRSRISFSEAIFSRETFFAFTVFEDEAIFAGAQFLGSADFSNSEFRRPDDLAKARFDQPPSLAQAKRIESAQSVNLLQVSHGQYAFTLALLVMAALLVAYAIKLK
ncbi:MAG: hypothetical protein A4E19_18620 [Nitrospira sp. SG-bin1]|nr:MAG: hypothetical protein A4E19_18620 [Nitrospira sp. SG-bin1]